VTTQILSPYRAAIKARIDRVNNDGRGLTDAEFDFMEKITERFEATGRLNDAEYDELDRIYGEKAA